MGKPAFWIGSTCLALALVVAWLGWRASPGHALLPVARQTATPGPAKHASASGLAKAPLIDDRTGRPRTRAGTVNPLLLDDLPLLKARADAGDPKAACRLGYKLLLCLQAQDLARKPWIILDEMPRDLGRENWGNLLAWRRTARTFIKVCRGAPTTPGIGFQYARSAAIAGEPEAVFRYARGDTVDLARFDPNSRELATWQREAPGMLQRSFRSGYLPAIALSWEANLGEGSRIDKLIPDEHLQAQALEFLMHRLANEPEGIGWVRYPEVATTASALAAQWQRDYFAGVARPVDLNKKRLAPVVLGDNAYSEPLEAPELATCSLP